LAAYFNQVNLLLDDDLWIILFFCLALALKDISNNYGTWICYEVTMTNDQCSLQYHKEKRPGKIEVVSTKSCSTAHELSLAYTPGVAAPTLAIKENPDEAYNYTAKGNLVAVISNGTAVLGLGNIGPLAAKPVMEGKGILFKKFADIDVFDIELDETDPQKVVDIIKALAPTFGGINLEDIKAPECFFIEQQLSKLLPIPVFHDDQHGTSIIAGAALLNALEIVNKSITQIKVVVSGAGAAALACSRFFVSLGVSIDNIWMADIDGVLYQGRTKNITDLHKPFLRNTKARVLAELFDEADLFLGLSAGKIVTKDMIKKMSKNPIIFALANPVPEIDYHEAIEARPDAIVATGRSDYPNQVNNVLGFPYIFRGALDTRATCINEEMKIAASYAIANLAKERIPESVRYAYGRADFSFGPNYILPKPFDPRVLGAVAPAVAAAATKTGVARNPIEDLRQYKDALAKRFNPARGALTLIYEEARKTNARIAFPEGDNIRVLQAADTLVKEDICKPVLLGNKNVINKLIAQLRLDLNESNIEIIDPIKAKDAENMAQNYFSMRSRKGITIDEARHRFRSRSYYAAMLLKDGLIDGIVAGITRSYPNAVRPILECVGTVANKRAMAMYMIAFKDDVKFFADTALHINPSAEELANIAIQTADRVAKDFAITPHIAVLSFSNFGSVMHPDPIKARRAVEIVKNHRPDLNIEGEMQADVALDENKRNDHFPFATLTKNANVLIFSNLEAANISYKLLEQLANCEAIGPILLGINGAANVCQLYASANNIVHMAAITAAASVKKTRFYENKK
jgi:malate dehydrogenase (oxaloacetate-decarboxylating)(NADP+)